MKRIVCLVLGWILAAGPVLAQQPLPIRRILLYKNGMAYVERSGEIRGPMSLTFHPDEMNDVLKTFTAWNPQSSALYSVGYTTGIPTKQMLTRFPFELENGTAGLAGFLQQITGASLRLELSEGFLQCRLIAVNQADRALRQQTAREDRLTILRGDGLCRRSGYRTSGPSNLSTRN